MFGHLLSFFSGFWGSSPILVTLLFDFETVYIGLCVHRLEDAYHAHKKVSPMLQYGTGDGGEFFFFFLTFLSPFGLLHLFYPLF